jgi:DNA repair exonuclease SbcCD ATPase subunit
VAEARHYLHESETEKSQAFKERDDALRQLKECNAKLEKTEQLLTEVESIRERMADELQKAVNSLREHKAMLENSKLELDETKQKESGLRQGLSTAREELQQLRKALAAAQAAAQPPTDGEPQHLPTSTRASSVRDNDDARNVDEETMASFQRELREARDSNEDLKQALANVITENDELKQWKQQHQGTENMSNHVLVESHTIPSDAESTPLFYAIEKQAELKTARDEIARLANFLSKVQSEKSEAEEAMAAIRQRMEEAETRLKLFEKFGRQHGDGETTAFNGNGTERVQDSGIVNIEYLKNIMLRYLNAKSVKEKKALVPAIGAVLEFTTDEQRAALQNVEQGASLGGVSSSLFETISFKLGS